MSIFHLKCDLEQLSVRSGIGCYELATVADVCLPLPDMNRSSYFCRFAINVNLLLFVTAQPITNIKGAEHWLERLISPPDFNALM